MASEHGTGRRDDLVPHGWRLNTADASRLSAPLRGAAREAPAGSRAPVPYRLAVTLLAFPRDPLRRTVLKHQRAPSGTGRGGAPAIDEERSQRGRQLSGA